MVDHMVRKLGKYLRILGYDADWDPRLRTHELIEKANREHRIFLTRNRRLPHNYPLPERTVLLQSTDPVRQFEQVIETCRLDSRGRLFSRCIRCNVALEPVPDKTTVRDRVHPNVYQRYNRFYTCPRCATVFWKGSHVRNTCRKLGIESPA